MIDFIWISSIYSLIYLFIHSFIHLFIYLPLKVKHCKELGIAGNSAARLIMFFGIASFSALFVFAGLGDCKHVNSLNLVQGGSLVIAVSILLLPLARTYTAFVVFSIVDGFCDGVMASQVNLLLLTTVSTQLRATAFGYANCLVSLSITIGPSVAGRWIFFVI